MEETILESECSLFSAEMAGGVAPHRRRPSTVPESVNMAREGPSQDTVYNVSGVHEADSPPCERVVAVMPATRRILFGFP